MKQLRFFSFKSQADPSYNSYALSNSISLSSANKEAEMEALFAPPSLLKISTMPTKHHKSLFMKTRFLFPQPNPILLLSDSLFGNNISKSKAFTTMISSSSSSSFSTFSTASQNETAEREEGGKFDWYAEWYPVMPVCDLDKRVPHAKRVMGLDIVVWWDRNEDTWKVFEDTCPHRLAPLSEGRIDQWGRLQCVYHGWCFNGSGVCKFIPQAPPDGPPVRTSNKACVVVYPSTVQNGIVWFWPNSDPEYKGILLKKKPPYIPELDDPSYSNIIGNRDMPFGYEILLENLMDPAHVPYAHYGLNEIPIPKKKADREGGQPIRIDLQRLDINGFIVKRERATNMFIPPCVFYVFPNPPVDQGNGSPPSTGKFQGQHRHVPQQRFLAVFMCVPVSPGRSRVIWTFPRNSAVWKEKIFPRWMIHMRRLLVLDSDLYLLHLEERKIMEIGQSNWQKACFLPTTSDNNVIAFRRWLRKYSGGQIDWGSRFDATLPPTPPKEQLMDRYWSHVVNCSSCNAAYKGLKALEVALQIISVASIGIVSATKQGVVTTAARTTVVFIAVLCFAGSRWLAHFIYKNFHFHDYNHALC